MSSSKSNQASNKRTAHQSSHNPFARALAEIEKQARQEGLSSSRLGDNLSSPTSIFDASQNRKSGQADVDSHKELSNFEELRKEQASKLKYERMLRRQHQEINSLETVDYQKIKERDGARINEVRIELKKLAEELSKFYQEVDITLTQEVVSTGVGAIYHDNFFAKLKEFIIMLRQRVSSARTWAKQAKAKQRKRSSRFSTGLDFSSNEAKAAHDVFHHERSSSYGA